ncbi:MAG: OB-fold nucleic acid binding domain-containing protein [Halobacteriota archaeon]
MQGNLDNLSDDVANIYERLANTISRDEFVKRVNQKVEDMSGLCDEKTAAMLVAHELGVDTTVQIGKIDAQTRAVAFVGKLSHISPTREFSHNGDVGHVANLVVSDETGSIRVVLWNDLAKHVEELQIGQTLKIGGVVKEGPYGLEVNAREIEVDESVPNTEVGSSRDKEKIADLLPGLNAVEMSGVVLEVGSVRTFTKRDSSVGKVSNITIGDETGRVRVTLWDDMAENVTDFISGDVVDIKNGYTRERYERLELHVGSRGSLLKGTKSVEFVEQITPIREVKAGASCTVEGIIENVGSLREFTRNNGSAGQVRNIVLNDDTGEIRAALWGEKAIVISEEDAHRRVILRDCTPKNGFENQLELSVDWRSGLSVAGKADKPLSQSTAPQESTEGGITGTVISSGAAVCVDNGIDYEIFDKAFSNLTLDVGDEVTVVGVRTNDKFAAKSVSRTPQDVVSRKLTVIKRRLEEL